MRPNIRQVAERAGVSRTTVSNVLLGKEGRISPAKIAEVLRVVEEMGYLPVRPSLQNRVAETRVIALALHDPVLVQYHFHSRVYAGICEAALRHDYDVLTVLRADPDWAVNRSAVRLLDRRSDGILFLPSDEDNRVTLEALVMHKIPTVVCYQREVPDGVAWVDPNNQAAIQTVVDLLVSSGHTRIAHLTYNVKTQFDFRERKRSFVEAIVAAGLSLSEESILEADQGLSPQGVKRLLASGVTAVVCANDATACMLWDLLDGMGVRVPQDVSITGIDNSLPLERAHLTTVEFSFTEVGSLAVEALIGLISGKSATDCCLEVTPRLIERESVRKL